MKRGVVMPAAAGPEEESGKRLKDALNLLGSREDVREPLAALLDDAHSWALANGEVKRAQLYREIMDRICPSYVHEGIKGYEVEYDRYLDEYPHPQAYDWDKDR